MIKKVVKAYYAHKSNINELKTNLNDKEVKFLEGVINNHSVIFNSCTIVKYDREKQRVSLIQCDDWDASNEPLVGDSYCFSSIDDYKLIKGSNKIYHNKWQFVAADYTGFNIEEAKKRTEIWNSIPNISDHKSRIGNREYWINLLRENNIEP